MSNSSTTKKLRQVPSETLHVSIDLGLEKNWVLAINERAERVDRFSFASDRGGYNFFLERVERVRQKQQAPLTLLLGFVVGILDLFLTFS